MTTTTKVVEKPKELIVPNQQQCEIIENEIMRLVNEYRASLGLTAYGIEPLIIKGARIRAEESSHYGGYGHERLDGTAFGTVLDDVGYTGDSGACAENLGGFSNSFLGKDYFECSHKELIEVAQSFFDGWKTSKGHNKSMIDKDYTKMGVGVYSLYETTWQGEKVVSFYGIQLFTLS